LFCPTSPPFGMDGGILMPRQSYKLNLSFHQ